jgi:beta-galactosidase
MDFAWREANSMVYVDTLFALLSESECLIGYEISADGSLKVSFRLRPEAGLPIIPAVGMMLAMPNTFDQISWYGNGPHESYIDRLEGVKLGYYEGAISDQYEPHIIPQETGNKTKVRRACIHNGKLGLNIWGLPEIELSALPYTPQEIEACSHAFDLPSSNQTVVRVNLRQMGLGGDRSWGPEPVPHAPYLLYTNRFYEYSYVMRGEVYVSE